MGKKSLYLANVIVCQYSVEMDQTVELENIYNKNWANRAQQRNDVKYH